MSSIESKTEYEEREARELRVPYDTNRATLPEKDVENARNLSSHKEEIGRLRVIVFDRAKRKLGSPSNLPDSGFAEPVETRLWMGRSSSASVVYCSIWVRSRDGKRYLSGRGSAGGYGYHKQSAALDDAIRSAGIRLAGSIGGCGEQAMEHALLAIAKAAGYGRLPMQVIS